MDKKLLEALNNLAFALEDISESLNGKGNKSDVGKSLQFKDFSNSLLSISESISELKSDTKELKDGQNTILKMLKNQKKSDKKVDSKKRNISDIKGKENSNPLGEEGGVDKSKSIKDGLVSILLIAVGVMAIGLALKIVGPVDILSVLAISGAVLLLANAFSEISKTKGLDVGKILMASFALVAISFAIVAVSYILGAVIPVSPIKLFNAIAIAAVFSVLSYGLGNMAKGVSEMKNPLLVMAVLPLVMIALSYAIMKSSEFLSQSTELTMSNFLTAVGISVIFVIAAYALPIISKAIEKVNFGRIVMLPAMMVLMSLAITASSYILAKAETIDSSKLFNIVLVGVAVSIVALAAGVTIGILGGFSIQNMLIGGINLVIISGAIVLASHLLAQGDYSNGPSIGWSVSVGLAMMLLSIPVAILGAIGLPIVAMGALGLVLVAGAIAASSYILSAIDPKFFYLIADAMSYFMQRFADAISYGMKVIAPALKIFINTVGGSLIKFAKNILPIIVKAVGELVESVLKPLGKLIKDILPVLGSFLVTVATGIMPLITIIIDGLKSVFTSITNILTTIVDGLRTAGDIVIAVINAIGDGISGVIEKIGKVIGIIGDKISKIINSMSGFVNSIGNNIVRVIDSIVGGIERLSNVGMVDLATGATKIVTFLGTITAGLVQFSNSKIDISKFDTITSLINGLSKFIGIIGDVNGVSIKNDTFKNMAVGIDQLVSSIDKLNNVIDIDKMNALRNLTGTVVMMSLMDSDQFGNMMDKLEQKSNVFASVINSMNDGGQSGDGGRVNVTAPSNVNAPLDKTNADLYNMLSSMDKKLGVISSNTNIVSNYINSLNSDIKIRKK
jgi:hypothetical protein